MVLRKRNRDGEFEAWTPAKSSPATNSVASESSPKPAKRARVTRKRVNKAEAQSPIPQTLSQASSSQQPNNSSGSKTAKSRKKANDDTTIPEKRGAIFKKACPRNILERVERVMSQRFFMIDRQRISGALKEVFSVLGSTGNVYSVTIDRRPSCNCPDALKGNHCKHILFIFLKVLQVPQESGVWYQKALLTSELEDMFAAAPLAPNSIAHPHIREAHARATGNPDADVGLVVKKRIPGPDDDCPICYDRMHGIHETKLVFCDSCGNSLHKGCFQEWQASTLRTDKSLTCVWCRAQWGIKGAGDSRASNDGYLNLSHISGNSPVRDTSTYYHGPRRGQRYDYGYHTYS